MVRSIVIAVLLLCVAIPARAQTISFALDTPSLSGAPGDRVTFSGTVTNTGAEDVYLNGSFFETDSPPLSLDPTSFFLNFAGVLGSGASITADLFDVDIDSDAVDGTYGGYFIVQGGADDGSFDDLATQTFQVRIGGADVVPEGRSLGLMLAAFLSVPFCRRWRAQPLSSAQAKVR